ncbi:MAG: hypothetical protein BWY79_00844 [Actinobacteria bacterium ADurb.Bin444]|nr:MAG: hypothetical protein BWY79_00844 [Actinobacteria bacterium ADurb.Bin444]
MDRQRIAVPYAGGLAETEAPSGAKVLWAHAPIGTETDPRDMITRALAAPRAQSLVPSVFRPVLDPSTDGRMVVVVNDATRPTPTGLALEALRSRGLLPETAVKSGRVEILVATGSHARGTDSDLEQILGSANMEALSAAVRWHDGHDAAAHVYLGKTQRGTPVWVDRAVVTAHSLVLINSVEPHYFAGYTGGRKSIVPGVAGFATIEANHRFALDPAADILALAGNPVHEDLEEAVAMLRVGPLFSIQLVLDGAQVATAAFAGGLHETFASAVDAAARAFVVDIPHRFDIVVTTAAPPMDYDLYQSQKALENAAQAVRPGGALILVSGCRHGIGGRAFFDLLAAAGNPDAALRAAHASYRLGYHKAARLASLAQQFRLLAVTGLQPHESRTVFLEPFRTLDEALAAAQADLGPEPSILVLPDGCVTVPRVKGAS